MRFPTLFFTITLFAAPILSTLASDIPAHDVAGARDHPMVSRFTGSVIAGYQALEYDEAVFPMGKAKWSEPDHFLKTMHVEGKVTRIFYVAPKGKTDLEVYRNFEAALGGAGFKVTYACQGIDGSDACGDNFSVYLSDPLLDPLHARNLMLDALSVVNGNVRYLTAHLERETGNVDLSLLVGAGDRTPPGILLQIVEAKPMTTDQVSVDAKAMGDGLTKNGHIALYGIQFTTGSATLEKDSDATLQQMVKLLQARPKLKVFIVGHTDSSGSLSKNETLSQQRADAVAKALVADYHISETRLTAKGLASFAPVASNSDEAGKTRNRRVELVEQ